MFLLKVSLQSFNFCIHGIPKDNKEQVCGLAYDDRKCKEGYLFFCKGNAFKPEYAVRAYKNGACAIVCENKLYEQIYAHLPDALILIAENISECMAICAAHFYGYPMKKLISVAVTGTKGKSTAVHCINSILNAARIKSAVLNELVCEGAPRLTTPEAIDFHAAAHRALQLGYTHIVCEISSQAQKTKRTNGIIFDYACFLNLGCDHISPIEHTDEKEYFECKRSLFKACRRAVVNIDDAHGRLLFAGLPENIDRISFSLKGKNADYCAESINSELAGCDFIAVRGNERFPLYIPSIGEHNAENALCAFAVAHEMGADNKSVFCGICAGLPAGRGRLFTTKDEKVSVIVDYAHNEMSFDAMFKVAKNNFASCIVTVIFGCPGDKAHCRRQSLARLCSDNADKVIICEDDSGYEGYESICDKMRECFESTHGSRLNKFAVSYIRDRKKALDAAFQNAFDGSEKHLVLMLGKGCEDVNRACGFDERCESDESIAADAIAEYDKKSMLSGELDGIKIICLEGRAQVGACLNAITVCSEQTAKALRKECFLLGKACFIIGEKEFSLSHKKLMSACNRGALSVITSKKPKAFAIKAANELEFDNLVYITPKEGILFGRTSNVKKLSYRQVCMINKAFPVSYLTDAEIAVRAGMKRVVLINDAQFSKKDFSWEHSGTVISVN